MDVKKWYTFDGFAFKTWPTKSPPMVNSGDWVSGDVFFLFYGLCFYLGIFERP